jgi:hypothetical protein
MTPTPTQIREALDNRPVDDDVLAAAARAWLDLLETGPTEEMVEAAVWAWDADVRRMFGTTEYDDSAWLAKRLERVLTAAFGSTTEEEKDGT